MKNSESRVLCKGENSKKIYCDQKKLVPGHPVWKIQSQECSVNEKIWKNFYLKLKHDQKKFIPRTPPLTNSEFRVHCKWKNFEKFLTSNLAWPKKVSAQITLSWTIQSPEHFVNEKIWKIFDLKFSVTKKG